MIRRFEINILTRKELSQEWDSFKQQTKSKIDKLEEWIFLQVNQPTWKLIYKTTHKCGSSLSGHYPIFNNPKSWLWKIKSKGNKETCTCTICKEKIVVTIGMTDTSYKFFKQSREEDVKELNRLYSTATNDTERTAIKKSLYKINHESKRVTNMRERLIKDTRNGNIDAVKDTHEYMSNSQELRNDTV